KRPNEPRTKVFTALVLGNGSKENRARKRSFFNHGRPGPYGRVIKRVYLAKTWNVSRGRVGSVTDHTCRSDATISARDARDARDARARPITSCDRPQSRLYAPLEPPCRQKPLNTGLWDEWPRSTGVVPSTAWPPWRVEAMRLTGRTPSGMV